MSLKTKPVIFLAYANDRVDPSNYLRDLVAEVRTIRRSLEAKVLSTYRLEERANANLDDILRVFDQYTQAIEVFHFAGHANELQLVLERGQGEVAVAGAAGFNRLLAQQSNLKLVFLNGCSTWAQAEALAALGVPAVIATSSSINDQAASQFASRFYERLAGQASIAKAFEAAEIKVQTQLGNTRSMYWEETATKDEFPWRLYGKGADWKLNSSRISKPMGNLLPLMCDREEQVEAFLDSLEKIMFDPHHQPHFYFVHGTRPGRHRSLVKRFKEIHIRQNAEKLFGKETGRVDFFEVLNWPGTGALPMRQRNLKRAISQVRELPGINGSHWEAKDFIKLQKERGGAVVFQHTISGDKWDTLTYKLIDWYINGFWNISVHKETPQIIIFLNVVYPKQRGSWIRRILGLVTTRNDIQREMEALAQKSPKRAALLAELNPISYSDVANWVDTYYPDELTQLPSSLFEGEFPKNLSMEVVEAKLKSEVERLEREKWLLND